MRLTGLLPASGRAERLNGLPKFAMPTLDGETLIARHARSMFEVCDRVHISTTGAWAELVAALVPDADLHVIAPSTMNDALQRMATDINGTYLVGMPGTYFSTASPYRALTRVTTDIGVAAWYCPEELRGRIGQVQITGTQITAMRDKDPDCPYEHLWGALRMSGMAIAHLDRFAAHPGLDLPRLFHQYRHTAVVIGGNYIDCGTPSGVHDMLNEEAKWRSPTATRR